MEAQKVVNFDLTLLCKVVGATLDVEVVESPGATTFSTDGRRVYVPGNIAGGELTAKIMRFGVSHEAAGHLAHTDFEAIKTWPMRNNGLVFGFMNVIEDPRIEKCAERVYPGARKINHEGIEELERRNFFVIPEKGAHPASVLTSWLIRRLRVDLLKQPLALDEIESLARETFSAEMLDKVLAAAKRGATGKATADAMAAAEAVVAILKETAEPPPPQPPQPPQEAGQKEEGSDSSGDGSQGQPDGQGDEDGGQGDSAGGGAGQGQPDASAPGGGEGDGSGSGADGEDGDQAAASNAPTKAQSDAAKSVLDANKSDMGPTDMSEIIGKAVQEAQGQGSGGGRHCNTVQRINRRTNRAYNASGMATALTAKLRSQMQMLLSSRVEDEDDDLEDRGRLNMRHLAKGVMGDRKIFDVNGAEGEGISTAVHLLVDASGSMSEYGKANAASSVIYAMSTAMSAYETQGAKFALSSFDNHVYELKGFEDRWIKAKNWLGNYWPDGSTMTVEAVRSVFPDLAARKEKRKALFVITDGDVGDSSANARINATAAATGVEVHVLVIGGHPPSSLHGFKSVAAVPANDQSAIQKAIFKLLTRFIQ